MGQFDILMTITLGVNMITRKITTFFSSALWALFVGIFHFCISKLSKFNPMGSPWSVKKNFDDGDHDELFLWYG